MPVLRPNSMPVAASPGAVPGFWGLPFCLLSQSTDRMRGFAVPNWTHESHYLLHFGLSTVGMAGTPQLLPGTMDREAVAIWRSVFALG